MERGKAIGGIGTRDQEVDRRVVEHAEDALCRRVRKRVVQGGREIQNDQRSPEDRDPDNIRRFQLGRRALDGADEEQHEGDDGKLRADSVSDGIRYLLADGVALFG